MRFVLFGVSNMLGDIFDCGSEAFVGAGAVVIEDVPDHTLVAGVPARFKKNLL